MFGRRYYATAKARFPAYGEAMREVSLFALRVTDDLRSSRHASYPARNIRASVEADHPRRDTIHENCQMSTLTVCLANR